METNKKGTLIMARAATKTTKTTTAKKTRAKLAPKATSVKAAAVKSATRAAPTPKIVSASTPKPADLQLKKKELIDKVVMRSGIKKKDAKPVVEAMLAILGETIAEGRELNLQPLGKLKINRMKQVAQSRIIICKLRQSAQTAAATPSPIADAAE